MPSSTTQQRWVLIETSGNQAFIFASNRLREQVGASQLTWLACDGWVRDAVADASKAGWQADLVLAASGKALILVSDPEAGAAIVQAVTTRGLKEAPGLDLRGIVGEPFDAGDVDQLAQAVRNVHADINRLRARVPGPESRFQRLPIVAPCATSGLPAAKVDRDGEEEVLLSKVAFTKRAAANQGFDRLKETIKPFSSFTSIGKLQEEIEGLEWLAVIHADGNGLGQIFSQFEGHLGEEKTSERYRQQLVAFSEALDNVTTAAFKQALDEVYGKPDGQVALVPLIVGGDDLTVVVDGRYAVKLARSFVKAFTELAELHPVIRQVVRSDTRLSSCAGVAIVKPHFPFHAAYHLAEQLLRSAKRVKEEAKGHAAIDYHVLYDTSGPDLKRIRESLTVDGGHTRLFAKPYVVTDNPAEPWAATRQWRQLARRVEAMAATDDVTHRRQLPNSQLHWLREGLYSGRAEADRRFGLIRHRYQRQGIDKVGNGGGGLFEQDGSDQVTGFLDALELSGLWEGGVS